MIVTAAQLAHLAELAAFAADYFTGSHAETARMFGETARSAQALSAQLHRDETLARHGVAPISAPEELAGPDFFLTL
jgi:hypothetical protein